MAIHPFVFISGLNAASKVIDQYLSKARQKEELKVRKELEALRRKAAEQLQEGEHAHAEKMFTLAKQKEIELIRLQHENQLEVEKVASQQALIRSEWENRQKNFPLRNFTALQVLDSPEALIIINRHEGIPKIDGRKVAAGAVNDLARVKELDVRLRLFLQKGYGTGNTSHSTRFLEGSWGNPTLFGEAAAINLHNYLESRATLFVEYQAIKGEMLVNVAYWGPGSQNPSHTTFTKFAFNPSDGELVANRLSLLQALAAAAAADAYYLARDLAAPLLPGRLPEILDGDEVIQQTVKEILAGYLAALKSIWEATPHRAMELTLTIGEELAALEDKSYAEPFLDASLRMFIELRGGTPAPDASYRELLDQATSLRLAQDEDYFQRTKGLRRQISEHELDEVFEAPPTARALGPAAVELTFGQRLSRARAAVEKLTEMVAGLRVLAPEDLDAYLSDFSLDELMTSLQKSARALEQPTLRVVPVGITSSGKSTLVGAVIGRAIVPRGAGELSVGVLRLVHRPGGLKVREIWEAGSDGGQPEVREQEYDGRVGEHDEAVEEYLKGFMLQYRREGYHEGQPFPRLEIETPLLPGNWRSIFSLPDEVGFEFRDVPGLNSTDNNDRNLAVIQEEIAGSFCIFILDWGVTRQDRDDKLLGTVRQILADTGADADSVVFILNKFNQWDGADKPEHVNMRIESFRAALQDGLGLAERPQIIKMNVRLWFNAQVAWGPVGLDEAPQAPPAVRQRWLRAVVTDDASDILRLPEDDPRRGWFIRHFIQADPARLSDENFRYFMKEIVYPISGAGAFCDNIADKVRLRCASLVIRPAVFETIVRARAFLSAVKKRYKDSQLDSADEITDEINSIRTYTEQLKNGVNEEVRDFEQKTVKTLMRAATVGQKGVKLDASFAAELVENNPGLGLFIEIVPNLTKDMAVKLARPLRDFQAGQAMPQAWRESLRENRAASLHTAAKRYFSAVGGYRSVSGDTASLKYEAQVENSSGREIKDSEGLRTIAAANDAYEKLLRELEEAMSERCRYELQRHLKALDEQARSLLELFYERVKNRASRLITDVDLTQAILASKQPPPDINTEVEQRFKAENKATTESDWKSVGEIEVARVKTVIKKATDTFRFLKRKLFNQSTNDLFKEVKKKVWHEREHKVSILPSGEGLEEQVNSIFKKYTEEVEEKLFQWLSDMLKAYAEEIVVAADKVSEAIANALQAQLSRSREEILERATSWRPLADGLRQGTHHLTQLEEVADDGMPSGRNIWLPQKG